MGQYYHRRGFGYEYSLYQVEYSRNLLFQRGQQMEQVFDGLIERTRTHLDIKRLKTIFGLKKRPFNPDMRVAMARP